MTDRRKIAWDLIARDKVSPDARKAGASLKNTGDDARTAGEQARRASDAFDHLGDEARGAAGDIDTLDRQLEQAEGRLALLATQITRAGDAADRADLVKKFRAEERDINQLKKLRGVLGDVAGDVESLADKLGGKAINLLGGTFASLPPQAQAGVAAAGAAIGTTLSAAVGGAVSAGVLLGLGGGVLAAGIKSALSNEHVQAAWRQGFGERAKQALAGFSDPFVQPLAKLAFAAGDSIERMAPALKRMGEALAPIVDKLGPALLDGLERALPGIEKAVLASVPLFEKLAEHAPALGEAIGTFFELIAKGGPGAVKFLEAFLSALGPIIVYVGALIATLSRLFQASVVGSAVMIRAILGAFDLILAGAATAFGWIPGLGGKLKDASDKFQAFKNRVNAELNGIQDEEVRVTVVYKDVGYQGFGRAGTAGSRSPHTSTGTAVVGFGPARALGGPVRAGHAYTVGDSGKPEVFVPDVNGKLMTKMPQAWAARRQPDAAAPGTQIVRILIEGTGVLAGLRKEIRVQGGDVQQVLGL